MLTKERSNKNFLTNDLSPEEIFTPEDFSDEHEMVVDLTYKFVTNEVMPELTKIEEQDFSETVRLMKKAGGLGLISADIPMDDGGLELGKVSATIISEVMAIGRSFSITFGGQTGIGALPIAYFGTEMQKKAYLPGILTGERIAAYALTEPSSGTDAMSIKTTAVLSDNGGFYILNGEKQWITNAAFANIFIVYAKVAGGKLTAFIVEKNYDGVSTGSEEKKMGLKGSSTRSLILENVQVPVENVIGEVGRGHTIAFNILNIGRHKLAATALGIAKRAIELGVKYANERQQFGQRISNFPLIKNKIADMVIHTYVNESAVYRTAGAMQSGFNEMKQTGASFAQTIAQYAVECSINKIMSTEVLDIVVDETLQIHGGNGYMTEYEIETLYRDSRVFRIFEGTNEINRILIADTLSKGYDARPEMNIREEEGPLQREMLTLELLKNLYHAAMEAFQKNSLSHFNEEQETAAFIADLVTGIYAAESSILRTLKAVKTTGEERNRQKLDCTKVYIHQTSQQIALRALNMIDHLGEEDRFVLITGRLIRSSQGDFIKTKRRIADFVINADKYKC
ncbi:acyl-CoA dehydrogenase family protein [Neobacillus sp. WH10]|uniref:acyl-CoA dehydrogenase family protein n=1 Tax=Neobacillus sp. WH10 TaxID=3047873 RepID=UPI0024C0F106|nr:acyl-CoA dehydrogenase family protein [Neobacillus sp. WH10]WHY78567.1 acyl-CoA dehydrogenase family protein [Neobacillus sp. WH10]